MTTNDESDKIDHCPALIAIKTISGKWKTRALWLLRPGEMSFNDLRRNLRGISAKVLTDHLREMEHDGLIYRQLSNEGNVQISRYGFTEYGSTLIPVLDSLGEWGLKHESLTAG